jgi:chaperonin GroEL (HSP60 family)
MLKKISDTTMSTKIISEYKDYLGDIAVDAVLKVAQKGDEGYKVDIADIKVDKKAGESMGSTTLIEGIALDKEVVHSGMPKRITNAAIALVNTAIEIEKTEFTSKINIESPDQMQAFLDQEEQMLRGMVDKIVKAGVNVLICQKGIES